MHVVFIYSTSLLVYRRKNKTPIGRVELVFLASQQQAMPRLVTGRDFDNIEILFMAHCQLRAACDFSPFGSIELSYHQHNTLIRLC